MIQLRCICRIFNLHCLKILQIPPNSFPKIFAPLKISSFSLGSPVVHFEKRSYKTKKDDLNIKFN